MMAGFLALFIVACDRISAPSQSPILSSNVVENCSEVEHLAGTTRICGSIERIAVLSPALLDILLSLDVQPAAYAEAELLKRPVFDAPEHQIPYLGDRLTTQPVNLGDRYEPSLETLLTLKPDLTLAEHDQSATYSLLSDIAPTILFRVQGHAGWKIPLQIIARLLNRENQAEQVSAAYNQNIKSGKNQLSSLANGQTMLVLGWNRVANQSFIFEPDDFICGLLQELGFQVISGQSGRPEISLESLSQIVSDHILVMPSGDNTIENARQQWENNPILQTMSAVKSGQHYFMDYQLTRIRGPIAAKIFLQEFAALVTQ